MIMIELFEHFFAPTETWSTSGGSGPRPAQSSSRGVIQRDGDQTLQELCLPDHVARGGSFLVCNLPDCV